ncbi:MAG: ATP-binding protein [Elusimicrobia bacterium]|nr:ATP-binding protein [Elusimicrobiota bacterium]
MLKDRYLSSPVAVDLEEKMVFISGPRQVGKTTLAQSLLAGRFKKAAYFNWDKKQGRDAIIAADWPQNADLIILDEIHKYKRWKRFVKGEYDSLKHQYKFLITGSARLDVYRKGGDSLLGRYRHYRLHPFSLAELNNRKNPLKPFENIPVGAPAKGLEILEQFGGFPEPMLAQDERKLRLWHNELHERLLREDIRDVETIRDLSAMQVLTGMLPSKVGSLLSINAIREDMEVSHRAVSNWLNILEAFYYQFRIYPFSRGPFRSLKKEPKLYLWDWSEVTGAAARFENMVASHLLKLAHWLHDREGYRTGLYFLRDSSKREVDFLFTVGEKPWFAVEVKTQYEGLVPNLNYFREKLRIPFAYQVINRPGIDQLSGGIRVISADKFLSALI